jgi:[ribosomal protein S5]-alanine N-acetyltransferase
VYHPFLIGEKIYLRGLERRDLDGDYFQWLNDYEVTKYLESGHFPNTQESMEKFFQNMVLSGENAVFAIVDKNNDKHIGNIKLGPIDWYHKRAVIGYLIGNREYWGKGYATEAIDLTVEYGFMRLGLHKIWACIAANHPASVRVCEKVGLNIEGYSRDSFFFEGIYYDRIFVGITSDQFSKIKKRQNGEK